MEPQYQSQQKKWVSLSYLALAALVGYIFFSLFFKIASIYDLQTRIRFDVDLIIRVASVGVSAVVFLILYWNTQANRFMTQVMEELARVTWPMPKETTSATFIVIVMVLISGVVLGLLDYFWAYLLKLAL